MMVVTVAVAMFVMADAMAVRSLEHQSAHNVYRQAQASDKDGFIEVDRQRMQKAIDRFDHHKAGNAAENNRAGEGAEDGDLTRAETVADVCGMAPRKSVCADGDKKCGDMGAHVTAVGEKGHRVQFQTEDNFGDHHDGRQDQDAAGALSRGIEGAQKSWEWLHGESRLYAMGFGNQYPVFSIRYSVSVLNDPPAVNLARSEPNSSEAPGLRRR